ncbi:MAG: hypothetical protein R2781_08265 [Flavobacteriaceae bacterium]
MTTQTDHQLIEQTLQGNSQAFSVLVERYQTFVFTIAVRMLRHRKKLKE